MWFLPAIGTLIATLFGGLFRKIAVNATLVGWVLALWLTTYASILLTLTAVKITINSLLAVDSFTLAIFSIFWSPHFNLALTLVLTVWSVRWLLDTGYMIAKILSK